MSMAQESRLHGFTLLVPRRQIPRTTSASRSTPSGIFAA